MWSEKRKFGNTGEEAVCRLLEKKGFEIVEQNFQRKWGEIDIVARKGKVYHFIEVKSVSYPAGFEGETNGYRAEDNVHRGKLKKMGRIIQTYLTNIPEDTEWVFDVAIVKILPGSGTEEIDILEDIVIEE